MTHAVINHPMIYPTGNRMTLETSQTPRKASILAAANIVKQYSGAAKPALDGFTLQVAEGQIVGLLGPNGAGKTTAVSILSTLMRPTNGQLSIMGADAMGNRGRIRQNIGLAPQDIALYESFSVRENLLYFGRMYGLKGAALQGRVVTCLEAVGLTSQADQRVAVFSGGMKRRANLAAAIIHAPRLLFLDEPTVGVDAQSRALIMDLLVGLKRDGTTMVYTTHYMEEAETLCDTVAIMDVGRIIVEGAPADLIANHPKADSLGALFLQLTGRTLRD
jgi:ABC-2 type transport system ATP-binding protein